MNYELALKLKKAGFPQKKIKEGDDVFVDDEPKQKWDEEVGVVNITKEMVRVPTLSELIEACPKTIEAKDFDSIGIFTLSISGDEWTAGYYWYEYSVLDRDGSTPEEAVVNLYLALNK